MSGNPSLTGDLATCVAWLSNYNYHRVAHPLTMSPPPLPIHTMYLFLSTIAYVNNAVIILDNVKLLEYAKIVNLP